MRFATEQQEAAYYAGRKFKDLELEEQARVRHLVFRGLLAWEPRKSTAGHGVPVTHVKLVADRAAS